MSDQCKHCTMRGDITECLATECFQHESWYAIQQQATIATLTEQVRAQDKWISVDVRLPEAYETDGNYHASDEVLVLCAGKLEFALYQYGPDSGGWESWYCHFYEDNLENVTHWMPLPTPPKEAE